MDSCVCSIDLGSSSIKAALINDKGSILSIVANDAPPVDASNGEFDGVLYTRTALSTIGEVVDHSGVDPSKISAISIASQRATLVLLDGMREPMGPALSWQGSHCEQAAGNYFHKIGKRSFESTTGLAPSFLYSVSKLAHLAEKEPERLKAARYVVSLHDYFLSNLIADDIVTDHSNASATGLYDIAAKEWSAPLLEALPLPANKLPRVAQAGTIVGKLNLNAASAVGLLEGTPIVVGGGDQQCATLGSGALKDGESVLSLGTAAVAMVPITNLPSTRGNGIFYACHLPQNQWIAEGFMNAYGSPFALMSEVIGSPLEDLAKASPAGAKGALYLPFLTGIGTPDFDAETRGAYLNLSLATGREEFARATLEGLAFEVRRLLEAFSQSVPIRSVRLVGGGQGNGFVPQLLSDVTGLPLQSGGSNESALIGAAALAWYGIGRHDSIIDAAASFEHSKSRQIKPSEMHTQYNNTFKRYLEAVAMLKGTARIHDQI